MKVYSLHKLRHRFNQQTKIDDLNNLVKDLKENPINKIVLIEQLFTFESILVGNSNKSIFDACFEIINIFHSTTIEKLSKYNIEVEVENDTLNEFNIESKSILLALQCKRLVNFYLYNSKEPIYIKFINNNVYTDFLIISKDIKESYIKELIIFATDPKHKNYNEVLDFLLIHYKKEKFLNSKDLLINEVYNYLEDLKKLPVPKNKEIKNKIFYDVETFEKFEIYVSKHIIEPYVDYSYLFQRMLILKLIHKKTHLEYVNWLIDNNYTNEKTKDLVIVNKGFRTLRKSYSTQRENNFNNVFNI